MSLVRFNFESMYLRQMCDVNIILPDRPRSKDPEAFYTNGKKYKVLWLLHGTYGDYSDWVRHSGIELYACEKDCIVVMPSAMNTNYENWPSFGTGYYFYDFFIKELMPVVHNWFPASSKREDNFISGLSMGSMGALKLALENPDKFGAVAALSGFLECCEENREWMEYVMTLDYKDLVEKSKVFKGPFDEAFREIRMFNEILNNGGTVEEYIRRNDARNIVDDYLKSGNKLKIMCACGVNDPLYPDFIKMRKVFEEKNVDATYMTDTELMHEWRFWEKYIQKAFDFFGLIGETGGREFVG